MYGQADMGHFPMAHIQRQPGQVLNPFELHGIVHGVGNGAVTGLGVVSRQLGSTRPDIELS